MLTISGNIVDQPQGQQGGQQHPQAPQSLDAYNAPGVLAMTAAEMQSVLSPDGGEQYFADGMATGSSEYFLFVLSTSSSVKCGGR